MSYLAQPTSKEEYGLVRIGQNINVTEDGIISSPSVIAGPGITVISSGDYITVSANAADLISVTSTTVTYTATATDEYIGVNSKQDVTIRLPTGVDGRIYTIKDEYGRGGGKITIQPGDDESIDKKKSFVMTIPHQSISVVFRAGNWWIV